MNQRTEVGGLEKRYRGKDENEIRMEVGVRIEVRMKTEMEIRAEVRIIVE
jgi:hypothetical protein